MAQHRILREIDQSSLFEGEAEHPITKKERKNRGLFFLNGKMGKLNKLVTGRDKMSGNFYRQPFGSF